MSKHTRKIQTKRKNKLKKKLLDVFEPICYWCNDPLELITLDHIKPLSDRGERYNLNNLCLSCPECNNLRSNNFSRFARKMKDRFGKNWYKKYKEKI